MQRTWFPAFLIVIAVAVLPFRLDSWNQTRGHFRAFGYQSPVVDSQSSRGKDPVLKNPKYGAVLVLSAPRLEAGMDQTKHVCMAPAGTPIELLGEVAKEGGLAWQKVRIKGGSCAGKIGWVSIENIQL